MSAHEVTGVEYRLKKSAPGWAKFLYGRKGRHRWKRWKRYPSPCQAHQARRTLTRKATLYDYRVSPSTEEQSK